MKTMKLFITLAVATFLQGSLHAQAQGLEAGSYQGTNSNESEIQLVLRAMDATVGNFLGILYLKDSGMAVYRVDPLDSSTYALIPITVDKDGEIGVLDANPTLLLNLNGVAGNGKPKFQLMSSLGDKADGMQGIMTFDQKKQSNLTWVDFRAGNYYFGDRLVASFSPLEDGNRSKALINSGSKKSGAYWLFDRGAGLFTLRPIAVTSQGIEVKTGLTRMFLFLEEKKSGITGKKTLRYLVQINPDSVSDFKFITFKSE